MKFGKTIKRIVALGIGASMVGATILGASAAASLNQYPAPFVKSGKFSGVLVVGDNAAAEDVVGVTDIAMSLQYAVSGTTTTTTTTSGTAADKFLIQGTSDKLNLFETVDNVKSTSLDSGNLKALAGGTFKGKTSETYTQKIALAPKAVVTYAKDTTDISDDPALYLYFPKTESYALQYNLQFDSAVDSKNTSGKYTDFENKKISILGKDYTITSAIDNKVYTLMAGAVQDTLEVSQTKKYTIGENEYEVTVMVVSGDTSASAETKLIVNDEVTDLLSAGDTFTLKDGTEIGIKEVIPTKSGDAVQNLVEFYLGAQKVVLDGNDNTIDIGEKSSIAGSNVTITQSTSGSTVSLSKIQINFAPTSSDLYVPVGAKLSKYAAIEDEDYGLLLDKLGVDYVFAGIEPASKESIAFKGIDDDQFGLTFTNINGVEYKNIPVFYLNTTTNNVSLGKESGKELFVTQTGQLVCKNQMFLTDKNQESHVYELRDVKNTSSTHTVTLKDLGTGDSNDYSFTALDPTISFNDFSATVTATNCITLGTVADETPAALWTKNGMKITLVDNDGAGVFAGAKITESNDKHQYEDNPKTAIGINFTVTNENTVADPRIDLTTPVGDIGLNFSLLTWQSKDEYKTSYTRWGTFVELFDPTSDQRRLEMTVPSSEAVADVYVTTAGAEVAAVSTDAAVTSGQKIDIGATKLASEVKGMEKTQNLILVGGPCANAAVERTSAAFPTCDAAAWPFQAGEALIQLVEQADGHVALLVAGTTAADTRTATGVVADMTKLKALPAGVTKQKVTVVSGQEVLTNVPVPAASPVASPSPAESPAESPSPAQ